MIDDYVFIENEVDKDDPAFQRRLAEFSDAELPRRLWQRWREAQTPEGKISLDLFAREAAAHDGVSLEQAQENLAVAKYLADGNVNRAPRAALRPMGLAAARPAK